MKLLRLHVENFGKLHNLDLDFKDGINEIIKENGWGKTTLSIFIKSLFYSMSARTRGDEYKSERSRYLSWQGGVYGGFIEYEMGGKRYRVTRTFGKTPEYDTFELFDYSNNVAIKEEKKVLGEEIFGVGEQSFLMTAFFPQLNFKSSSNSELTANLTGVNKYQDDLESIDKAIKVLKTRKLEVKRNIPKKSDIEEKRMILNQVRAKTTALSQEIEEKERELTSAKEKKKQIDDSVIVAKDKLALQEEKYQNKLSIESKIRDLTSQVATLYEKQSSIQDKAIANLNGKEKDKKNYGLIIFAILLAVLAVGVTVLYVFNVIDLTLFISILAVSIITLIILVAFITLKTKKDRELNSKIGSSVDMAKNFKEQIDDLNNSLKKLDKMLNDNYANVTLPKRDDYEEIKNKQNSANMNIYSIENSLLRLRNDLEESVGQEEYISSQIELLKEGYTSLNEKYSLVEKTIDFLLKARDNVASRYVSSINGEFSQIMKKFNIDENRFIIDNQWTVKEQTSIGTKDFEYSSQGIQDIISFCQRISLINKIYKKEKPFVILDDTFVNLDDNMLECAKEVVKELSKEFQVVYICCHSRCSILN